MKVRAKSGKTVCPQRGSNPGLAACKAPALTTTPHICTLSTVTFRARDLRSPDENEKFLGPKFLESRDLRNKPKNVENG